MVADDALTTVLLERFTLGDNPLSCDCGILEFASWLNSTSNLTLDDRTSAVCATPQNLEGGVLLQVTQEELVCNEDNEEFHDAPGISRHPPHLPGLSSANEDILLEQYTYSEDNGVILKWNIIKNTTTYKCNAVFVYEEMSDNESLLDSSPVHCEPKEANPNEITITVPGSKDLQTGHRYRYCLVVIKDSKADDLNFISGCTDIITLIKENNEFIDNHIDILDIKSNVSSTGELRLKVTMADTTKECMINAAIFAQGSLIAKRDLHCSALLRLQGFLGGPYTVCAALIGHQIPGPFAKCAPVASDNKYEKVVETKASVSNVTDNDLISFVGLVTLVLLIVVVLLAVWAFRRMRHSTAPPNANYAPPSSYPQTTVQPRYVKLQATTTL